MIRHSCCFSVDFVRRCHDHEIMIGHMAVCLTPYHMLAVMYSFFVVCQLKGD